jgi:antitoxin component YwqK of YwqJK toxin-antitoxin module
MMKKTYLWIVVWLIALPGMTEKQRVTKYFKQGVEITEEEFTAGRRTGQMVLFDGGVKILEIGFLEGKKHGRWISWLRNGKPGSEFNYSAGVKHGQNVIWYENGQKKMQGKYNRGEKDDRWLYWDSRGNQTVEELWRHGRIIVKKDLEKFVTTSYIYYPGGNLRYQREFRGALKHGRWIKWDHGGARLYVREYKEGMKHGHWQVWNKNGVLVVDEIWDKGEMIKKGK